MKHGVAISKFLLRGRVAANKTLPYFDHGSVAAKPHGRKGLFAENILKQTLLIKQNITKFKSNSNVACSPIQPSVSCVLKRFSSAKKVIKSSYFVVEPTNKLGCLLS